MRSFWFGLTAAFLVAASGCTRYNLTQNACSDCCNGGQYADTREYDSQVVAAGVNSGTSGYVGDGGCNDCGTGGAGYGTGLGNASGYAGGMGHGAGHQLGRHFAPGHLMGPTPTPVAWLPHGYMDDRGPSGPQSPTYGYPYYTLRGPRDFLLDNPPSIGY